MQNEVTDIGYKLHSIEVELEELRNEIKGFRDHLDHATILIHDFIEIEQHFHNRKGMFLMKTYEKKCASQSQSK
jgi:hypothetical protein